MKPLVSEPTRVNEALTDLNSELFSAKPETKPREPDKDLNNEDFSTKPEAKAREPDKDLARPLT